MDFKISKTLPSPQPLLLPFTRRTFDLINSFREINSYQKDEGNEGRKPPKDLILRTGGWGLRAGGESGALHSLIPIVSVVGFLTNTGYVIIRMRGELVCCL